MGRIDITILRHSNAVPAANDSHEADMTRHLSEKGQLQATERREVLGNQYYTRVYSSPATRTLRTAQIVSGKSGEDIQALPELFWIPGTEFNRVLGELFPKFGYAPLTVYRDHAGSVFDDQAREAWFTLVSYMDDCFGLKRAVRILIVGHAVLVNALGCAMAADPATDTTLSTISFGECEGFTLSFVDDGFDKLTLHQ